MEALISSVQQDGLAVQEEVAFENQGRVPIDYTLEGWGPRDCQDYVAFCQAGGA